MADIQTWTIKILSVHLYHVHISKILYCTGGSGK